MAVGAPAHARRGDDANRGHPRLEDLQAPAMAAGGDRTRLKQQRALLHAWPRRVRRSPAKRLVPVLAGITDPNRTAEIGDWLVRCNTAAQFLARVAEFPSAAKARRET